jgi:hypothetical protein
MPGVGQRNRFPGISPPGKKGFITHEQAKSAKIRTPSVFTIHYFQSGSAEKCSGKVRLKNKNQGLIDPESFFNRDYDRDEFFSNKV